MKKILTLAIVVAALLPMAVSAQSLNVRVGVGYTGNFGTDVQYYEDEPYRIGWGRGVNVGASIGYQFNDFLQAELGFGYLLGLDRTIEYTSSSTETISGVTISTSEKGEDVYSSGFLQIMPALTVGAFANDFAPYARFGVLIGFGGGAIETTSTSTISTTFLGVTSTTTSTGTGTNTYSGGIAFGFQGALGARYNVSESFGIFAEIVSNNWTNNPTTLEIEAGGTTTEYDLVDKPESATELQDTRNALNSLGINVGINFSF
jgi:Outer membrane protein beta-barrel domain